MRLGILKPDHLGDMVLAAPALAALTRRFPDLTILCHPAVQSLAAHLFPGLRSEPIRFPHLDKERRLGLDRNPLHAFRDRLDSLVSLRWDPRLDILLRESGMEYRASGRERFDEHVAVEQRSLIAPLTGPYEILRSYSYPHSLPHAESPTTIARIGLCISAGFHLNAWPLNHWLSLGKRLHQRGFQLVLLGGPGERVRLRVLADAWTAALGRQPACLIGGSDYGAFLRQIVGAVDLVIATDSGTAHLVSLVRPLLSLFGGSPWQRYAPLGECNAVVSRLEACSPCRQFDRTSVSTCHTQECLNQLIPEEVERCLDRYLADPLGRKRERVGRVYLLKATW